MSWVIEITHVPVAPVDEDAWEQLEILREEEEAHEYGAPPSKPLRRLYDRLSLRFPCILEDANSPWADGPLINNFGDQLATVGLIVSRMEDALPFVIETATDMGFTVFDAGAEEIFRPKGWQPPEMPPAAFETRKPWWKLWW
jgi:hypothetical protein